MSRESSFLKAVQIVSLACLAAILFYPALTATTINLNLLFDGSDISSGGDFSFINWLSLLSRAGDSGALNAIGASFLRSCAFMATIPLLSIPGAWPRHLKWLYISLAIFLIGGLASALLGTAPYDAVVAWSNIFASVCCFVVASSLTYRFGAEFSLRFLAKTLVVAGIIVVVWAWAMFIDLGETSPIMYGTFYNQNLLAGWLLLIIPLVGIFIFENDNSDGDDGRLFPHISKRAEKFFVSLATASFITTIYFGYNRTAWAIVAFLALMYSCMKCAFSWKRLALNAILSSISVTLGVVSVVYGYRGDILTSMVIAVVALAIVFYLVKGAYKLYLGSWKRLIALSAICFALSGLISQGGWGLNRAEDRLQQLAQGDDSSGLARWEFYRAAISIAIDNPWLGVGPQGFERFYPSYQRDARWYSKYSHCLMLDLACEYGIPLALLFLSSIVYGFWLAIKIWKSDDTSWAKWRLGLMLGWFGAFLHAQADVDAHTAGLLLTDSIVAGVILGAPSHSCDKLSGSDRPRSKWSVRPIMLLQYAVVVMLISVLAINVRCIPSDYYSTYARYCQSHGQLENAREYYESAIENNPFCSDYRCRLVLTMMDLGLSIKDESIRKTLDENSSIAVMSDPHRAACHEARGQALEYLERWEEALGAYETALSLDRFNLPGAYFGVARTLYHMNRVEQAQSCLQVVVDTIPATVLLDSFYSVPHSSFEAKVIDCWLIEAMDPRSSVLWEYLDKLESTKSNAGLVHYGRGRVYLELSKGAKEQNDADSADSWRQKALFELSSIPSEDLFYPLAQKIYPR